MGLSTPGRLQCRQQRLYLLFDEIPDRAKLLRGHRFGIRNAPFLMAAGAHVGTGLVATARANDGIVLYGGKVQQRFRLMPAEIVANFLHSLDGFGVDPARWA